MRRFSILLVILLLSVIACRAVLPETGAGQPLVPQLFSPSPPAVFTPESSRKPSPTETSAPTLTPLPEVDFTVRLHPDGPLYVGDRVSLEVIPPQEIDMAGRSVQVQVDRLQNPTIAKVEFGRYGIGNRLQATLLWAWNTSGLQPGTYHLTFNILPDGPTWTQTVELHPASEIPLPQPEAHWEMVKSQCCNIYYITGTAAERDLKALMAMADEQAKDASQRMGVEIKEPIPVTFLPRVLGHGGFTGQEISVSYLDRNYMVDDPAIVLHHEMIHLLDNRLGGDFRPSMLMEGLAVYLSGGHFKPEPLMPRAAALLPPAAGCVPGRSSRGSGVAQVAEPTCGLDLYLPLASLANDFYHAQHDIGYLEAGALVEYIVDTWGWDGFSSFYRDIHTAPDRSQVQAINLALQKHFNITFDELEKRFLEALRQEPDASAQVEDLRLTVDYYNTARRYQAVLDPSAYFLTAWLPDPAQMRKENIVADYLRQPAKPENLALEAMLLAADDALQHGESKQASLLLEAANTALDAIEQGKDSPFTGSPLAADYYSIVQAVQAAGYEPQRVELNENKARVQATTTRGPIAGPELVELSLLRSGNGWVIGVEFSFAWDLWAGREQESQVLAPTRGAAGVNPKQAGYQKQTSQDG